MFQGKQKKSMGSAMVPKARPFDEFFVSVPITADTRFDGENNDVLIKTVPVRTLTREDMGIPKFYRWISERYPNISRVINDNQIPDFDNFYLDMNGIIHACSHVNDDNCETSVTVEEIFRNIFHYIDFLFRMIKPKKVFFMAVDGVAPRAKMNQQRSRRFRAGRDRIKKLKSIAEKTGQTLKETIAHHFDTNSITPGTSFMTHLDEQLRYFINVKISTDPLWAGVDIHLSGHLTPGEGEHKIMEYIRYTRTQPGYDVNTRHCLYGLDADLIMLGLVTHEMHFALLREEVKYGGKKAAKILTPEEINWHLLQLCLLRDYIDLEFSSIKNQLKFPYDLESILDDWILMGYLVGNDFIPHLPHVHINQEALPLLWNTYKKVLPTLDGYMNESGQLNLSRFERYIHELAKYDYERFENEIGNVKDLHRFGSSRGKRSELDQDQSVAPAPATGFSLEIMEKLKIAPSINSTMETTSNNDHDTNGQLIDSFINNERKSPGESPCSSQSSENNQPVFPDPDDVDGMSSDSEQLSDADEEKKVPSTLTTPHILSGHDSTNKFQMQLEFRRHKHQYYREKLKQISVSDEQIQIYVQQYIEALQWVLKYYYEGCPSWSWFYPHHYAPYLSDLKDFKHLQFTFERGTPFKPFEQLLAVLPPTSRYLLPPILQSLMIDSDSPLLHFYPEDFLLDQNEKKQDWEAIVLLPFIDEKLLLESIRKYYPRLTPDEQQRNQHGPSFCFQYTPTAQPTNASMSKNPYFPPLKETHAKCIEYPVDYYRPVDLRFRHGRFDEKSMTFFPKFPVLNALPYTIEFKKGVVEIFESRSKSTTLALNLTYRPDPDFISYNEKWTGKEQDNSQPFQITNRQGLIERYLGKPVFVNWPHFEYGVVCAISDFRSLYTWSNIPGGSHFSFRPMTNEDYFDSRHLNQTPIYVSRCPFEVSEESTKTPTCKTFPLDPTQVQMEYTKAININRRYENRQGVTIGSIPLLLYVAPLIGYRTKCSSTSDKCSTSMCFSNQAYAYPLQTTVMSVPNYRHDLYLFPKTITEYFRTNDPVFALQAPHYSSLGYVQEVNRDNHGKYHVQCRMEPTDVINQPDIHQLSNRLARYQMHYWTAQEVADYLHTMPCVISKMTGTIIVTTGSGRKENTNRINVGFSWKGNKPLKQLYGYTKKHEQTWHYSDDAVLIIGDYMMQFPEIIAELMRRPKDDTYAEANIWPARKGKSRLQEVRAWIKKLPTYSMQLMDGAWEILDAPVIKEIEKVTKGFYSKNPKPSGEKTKSVSNDPNRLFKATDSLGMCDPDIETHYELYDRVITVRLGTGVPIGTRGTIIGVLLGQTHLDTYYEVLFDQLPKNSLDAILLGRSNQPCRIKVRSYHLLNYSHSLRTRPMIPSQQRSMPGENVWERRNHEQSASTTAPSPASNASKQNQQPTRILKRGASENIPATNTNATTTATPKSDPKPSTTPQEKPQEKPKLVDMILASAKEQASSTKSPVPSTVAGVGAAAAPTIQEKPIVIQPLTESAFLAPTQSSLKKASEPNLSIGNSQAEVPAAAAKPSGIESLLKRALQDSSQLLNPSPSTLPISNLINPSSEIPSLSHPIGPWTNPNGQSADASQKLVNPVRNQSETGEKIGALQSPQALFSKAIQSMQPTSTPNLPSSSFTSSYSQQQQQQRQQQPPPFSMLQHAIQQSDYQLNLNSSSINPFDRNSGVAPFQPFDLFGTNNHSSFPPPPNPNMMPFPIPSAPMPAPAHSHPQQQQQQQHQQQQQQHYYPQAHPQHQLPQQQSQYHFQPPPVTSFQQSPGRVTNPVRMESPQIVSAPPVFHPSPPSQPASAAPPVTSPRATGGSTLQFVPSQVLRNMPKKS